MAPFPSRTTAPTRTASSVSSHRWRPLFADRDRQPRPPSHHPLPPSHIADDPSLHLHALVSQHTLPLTSSDSELPAVFPASITAECLPQSHLRFVPLLDSLHQSLAEVAHIFAPHTSTAPGPTHADTVRFQEHLGSVTECAQQAYNAPRFTQAPPAELHRLAKHLVVKYLFRPLNELLECMLLPTGVQVNWRLTADSGRERVELIWNRPSYGATTVATVHLRTPVDVSDTDMNILLDHVRRGTLHIDNDGCVALYGPACVSKRTTACRVAGEALEEMFTHGASLSVLTNCNRFVVLNAVPRQGRGAKIIEFSDLVVADTKASHNLCSSPFGLFLGLTVLALRRRGVALSRPPIAHPTVPILDGLLDAHFGADPDRRKSRDMRQRRRAVFGVGMYPSQLGATALLFTIPAAMSPNRIHPTHPFYGPHIPTHLPHLLADPRTDALWIPELDLAQHHAGTLWDIFLARFAWLPNTSPDLVVKLANMSRFPDPPASYTRDDAVGRARTEVNAYLGALAGLHGRVVPRFKGLFGSCQAGEQLWAALFEDAGAPLVPAQTLDPVTRYEIPHMYTTLHAAGVLHGQVAWRHIVCRGGAYRLVDFAVVRCPSESDAEWEAKCCAEMRAVYDLMGRASLPGVKRKHSPGF